VIVYLDTSVVLRIVLGDRNSLVEWGKWQESWASEIMGLEARRVLDRMRLAATVDDEQVGDFQRELARVECAVGSIALTRAVIRRAGQPMGTAVKTLDAIHLTSALIIRERRQAAILFATHDTQQARAARALGFECLGL
jgi:hypothetical protein